MIYLDNAATSYPKPDEVVETVKNSMVLYGANPGRSGYDFSVKMKDREEKISISISQKGGHVIQTETNREVKKERISQEEANQIGK